MTGGKARRLDPAQACFRSDVRALGIRSTDDAESSDALGDPRGEQALELALRMSGPGYHAFVCGVQGPQRLEHIAEVARRVLQRHDALADWVYVHSFRNPDRPRAIRLPPGDARRLQRELDTCIRELRDDLPRCFRDEGFDDEKQRIIDEFESEHRRQGKQLEELAQSSGLSVVQRGTSFLVLPLVNGQPIEREEDLRILGPERVRQFEKARKEFQREVRAQFQRHQDAGRRVDERIHQVERAFAERIVRPRIEAVASHFESSELRQQLGDLLEHLLDHLDPFRGGPQIQTFPFEVQEQDPFAAYAVNIVVDNSQTDAPPVHVVDSPTYKNLFGTIDRTFDRFGHMSTDFRRIHAGALLEADGGVVVLNAEDALVEPFVWRILRRALRSGRVEIEAYDPFVLFTPAGIRPEPIQVRTKVVLLGSRYLFELLLRYDDEFADLFKVLADFSPIVDRTPETTRALCGRITSVVREENLLPFEASALDALVELSVREAGDRRRLHMGSETILDAAREADARARRTGRSKATREDVAEAVRERIHRLDRIEESIRDAIDRKVLLVDLEGERIGQLNALAVTELGGRAFGRPSRVTATVGVGTEGVVSIDRETKLSGKIHDKGVLILEGLLRNRFAHDRPLSLVASVAFEQSYATVEGDSASLAELIAILSRLGNFPVRQDLALTGSVNQVGEVQAVGGINEKIEGFFDCCKENGLSGEQGVVLPAANVEHLVLRDDVVAALEEGRFHLYPVHSVDEALEILTGRRAGSPEEVDTLNYEVDRALEAVTRKMKEFTRR